MKNVLILGAGQSSPFLISYMLENAEKHDWFITVCDRDVNLANQRINNHCKGKAVEFDVNDAERRNYLISKADLVINMLAPKYQYMIALDCLNHKKHCITASYENPQIFGLHNDAKKNDILILNEMGLDPGIDHMSAMAIIDSVRANGGEISSFISYGSGVPEPGKETNPLKYTITWNPRNVVMAGESGAQYMEKGKIKLLSRNQIFKRTWKVEVDGVGSFEAYPNRNSLIYVDLFKLPEVKTMIRATLRYPGWSSVWHQLNRLGMPNELMVISGLKNMTFAEFTEMFIPLNSSGDQLDNRIANFLDINPTGFIMEILRWLGLFSDKVIGGNPRTAADVLQNMLLEKMPLPEGVRDMVILQHVIKAKFEKGNVEKITATFVEYGDVNGYTAMSKTVGLPAAIAAKLVLTDKLTIRGCRIPTNPEIYKPVLNELEKYGMRFSEKIETIEE